MRGIVEFMAAFSKKLRENFFDSKHHIYRSAKRVIEQLLNTVQAIFRGMTHIMGITNDCDELTFIKVFFSMGRCSSNFLNSIFSKSNCNQCISLYKRVND